MFVNNLIISVIVIKFLTNFYKEIFYGGNQEDIILKKFNETITFTLPIIVFMFISYTLFKDNNTYLFNNALHFENDYCFCFCFCF